MARQKRLNITGATYHVITRGLNGMKIFKDSKDRREFISRLSVALKESKSQCYAWVLMSNHIHLLLRASEAPLSNVIRRVLSGYAKAFNKKYKRRGYLYQNRFKSILCQEDTYFLQLVRYIHLNPVRAGMIKSMEELEKYPYSGHQAIIGKSKNDFQQIDEVLSYFGSKRRESTEKYMNYLDDGWAEGKREDLTGGGLRRSAGGWEGVFELKKMKDRWHGDDRILGDGEFVTAVLKNAEEQMRKQEKLKREGWSLEKLVDYVCRSKRIRIEDLKRKGRGNSISEAKEMIAYWGYNDLGKKGSEIAKCLGINKSSTSYLITKGKDVVAGRSLFEHSNSGT